MRIDYTLLSKTIDALIDGETDPIAKMATIACEVHHSDDRFDWTGFYRVVAPELLKIGPYQGGHGCLVIPFSKGVCGAAARHIACSSSTLSELVLPVRDGDGHVIAIFDIDSNQTAAFTSDDAEQLQKILDRAFAN
jgi:L-methionine (R)-S-oxide reductase